MQMESQLPSRFRRCRNVRSNAMLAIMTLVQMPRKPNWDGDPPSSVFEIGYPIIQYRSSEYSRNIHMFPTPESCDAPPFPPGFAALPGPRVDFPAPGP